MNRLALIFLIFLSSIILFYRLGATTLVNWDEAMFASVAQDMVKRGDLLDGRMNGQVWVYEPPLLTWILALVLKTVGPQEFWLRVFSAFCGIVIGIVVYIMTVSISGKKLAGLFSFVILFSDIEFLFRARQINVEIPLTMFLLIALGALVLFRKSNHHLFLLPVAAAALGFAFLTKRASPLLALPALLSIIFVLRHCIPKKIWVMSLAVFLSVSVPWYVASSQKWGMKFIHEFFLDYTFGKIRSVNLGTGTSILFYFSALRHAFKLWMIPMPIVLLWCVVQIKKNRIFLALLFFIATYFLMLTVVPIKSSWFLLPIHPVLSILTGLWLSKFHKPVVALVIVLVAVWQVWNYRSDFIVPDTTGRQVAIIRQTATLLGGDEPLYLDDDYVPVAVFYSGGRKIIPLRFDRLGRQGGLPAIPLSGSLILSNDETIEILRSNIQATLFLISSVGDLKLLRVEPNQ